MTRPVVVTAIVVLVPAGCDEAAPRVPHSVSVSPARAVVNAVGDTVPYRAQVRDADGDVIYEADIHWSSADERVATVSGTGVATVKGHGSTSIRASHGALYGSGELDVVLEPARLTRVAGESQTAPGLSRLPVDPAVRVEDASGVPVPGIGVRFVAAFGSGDVNPEDAVSDSLGIASTRWTLGRREGEQRIRAWLDTTSIVFTATATAPDLTIATTELARARMTVAYREVLAFIGRHEPPLTWSVTEGSLPPGISLDSTGVLFGTATEPGTTDFTITVRDASDSQDSRALSLQVCDPPLQMEPGAALVLDRADFSPCPPLLPGGDEGDRYRVATLQSRVFGSGALPVVNVAVRAIGDASASGRRILAARSDPARHVSGTAATQALQALPPSLATGVRIAETTARHHATLFAEARQLMRSLGPGAVLPDTRATASGRATASDRSAPSVRATESAPTDRRALQSPPERLLLVPYRSGASCSPPGPAPVPALLVGHSDHLAIYQDSVQRDSIPVAAQHARAVLDYYTAYGAETISEFFGDVPDVNGDGRVNVFVSPVVSDEVAAFVWPGDFLAKSRCAVSNEMELVYYNENLFSALGAPEGTRHFLALPTMVHEVKHIVSVYRGSLTNSSQSDWIEEGTAEIASEMSSRKAMEAVGGVPRGAMIDRDAYPPREGSIVTPENYGMLVSLARTSISYVSAVNSIAGNYSQGHNYYGTAWHFHRFLGDAYGGGAQRAEGELFRALSDAELPVGFAGIEEVTGKPIASLLEEYATAMMMNGTDAARPERGFRTYDFPSATFELFRPGSQPEGLYPWPVTGAAPAPFRTDIHIGYLAPGGVRFHDFESDGSGAGIEIDVSADPFPGLRVVIVRMR